MEQWKIRGDTRLVELSRVCFFIICLFVLDGREFSITEETL